MRHHTRRQFLRRAAVGPSLVCSLAAGSEDLLGAQSQAAVRYDLVVKGGRVVDPAQGLSRECDVAISGRKIARVAPGIGEGEARRVLNARDKIVTRA